MALDNDEKASGSLSEKVDGSDVSADFALRTLLGLAKEVHLVAIVLIRVSNSICFLLFASISWVHLTNLIFDSGGSEI